MISTMRPKVIICGSRLSICSINPGIVLWQEVDRWTETKEMRVDYRFQTSKNLEALIFGDLIAAGLVQVLVEAKLAGGLGWSSLR